MGKNKVLAFARALLSRYGQPAASAEPIARDWKTIEAAIDEYLDGYEFRGDGGDYTPTENERLLIDDAIHGLLDDEFLTLLATPVAQEPNESEAIRAWQQFDAAMDWANHLARMVLKYFGKDVGAPDSGYEAWKLARDIIKTAAPAASPVAQRPVGVLECHVSGNATFWPDEDTVFKLAVGDHPVYAAPVAAQPRVPESVIRVLNKLWEAIQGMEQMPGWQDVARARADLGLAPAPKEEQP